MTREEWRPVVGYEGIYEVSSLGRVRGVDRVIVTAVGQVRRQRGTTLRPALSVKGRLAVNLRARGAQKTRLVHHLVLESFIGPRPEGMVACHNDGNCLNNVLPNLRWDSPSANMLDAVRHGTHNHARKTRCPRRHRLIEPNLRLAAWRAGERECLACDRARTKARRAGKRGLAVDVSTEADMQYLRIMGEAAA